MPINNPNQIHSLSSIKTLDLNFKGMPQTIASYLIPHPQGCILIESGPGSTVLELEQQLHKAGYSVEEVTDVFITHIHLDHAGACGWLASHGATIHVHPNGAPHLIDPTRLIESVQRIYGDQMKPLWGDFLPVPADKVNVQQNGEWIKIHGLEFQCLDTPGHAEHHFCIRFQDLLFTGDIGGVRLPGISHLELPTLPPDTHLGKWRSSLEKLRSIKVSAVAPTHFGIHLDPETHWQMVEDELDKLETWLQNQIETDPELPEFTRRYQQRSKHSASLDQLEENTSRQFDVLEPAGLAAAGLWRYWHKFIQS